MLKWIFGKRKGKRKAKPGIGKKPPYEKARDIAGEGNLEERRKLAAHEDMEPEILYFLASDKAPEVRREIAENAGTPLQADALLAKDPNEEVRCELARKISRLIPELKPEQNEKLADMAMNVLTTLARDELPRVRAIVAEELKHATNVPKDVIKGLAEDLEDIVSAPILEYSPLLSGKDLLQLIASGMKSKKLAAIASRRNINTKVVEALVNTGESEAVHGVLKNKTANINDNTYDKISVQAEGQESIQHLMVNRDDLPMRTIQRISRFVNGSLMEALMKRHSEQKELVDELRATVKERIDRGETLDTEAPFEDDSYEPASIRVEKDFAAGLLNEERLDQALKDNDNTYVRFALGKLSGFETEDASKMINTGLGKAIVSLSWKSGLSMGMAVKLQTQIARIKRGSLLTADADGRYPITEDEMDWYLESFL
ncbi:MAG: DUF2336 domain-containing protein [Rhodospirillales bacterium]|nr:DUF2336 domain-containing protein [Rhodospirillales bacterium]